MACDARIIFSSSDPSIWDFPLMLKRISVETESHADGAHKICNNISRDCPFFWCLSIGIYGVLYFLTLSPYYFIIFCMKFSCFFLPSNRIVFSSVSFHIVYFLINTIGLYSSLARFFLEIT
jgi:hypothetical protein